MYDYLIKHFPSLADDDIRGIQHIYGIPQNQAETVEETLDRDDDAMPDKCNMNYDAIAAIRGELFVFHGKYMWRPDVDSEVQAHEIRQMWTELPENLKSVDAVYEGYKNKILFFIGGEIFIFDGAKLNATWPLHKIGMDESVKKIDAVFRLPANNKIYIISGGNYWRFDEDKIRVIQN